MIRKEIIEKKENQKNIRGKAEIHHILTGEELNDNIRMFAKVVLKPCASIIWHQHKGETEPYYILSGNGVFTDSDQSEIPVKEGDVCLIENMQYHGIRNISDVEDLVFMALIYKQ